MHARLLAASLVAALLLTARSRPAQACGATPPPYVTLATSQPADGATNRAPDAPLVIHGTAWPTTSAPVSLGYAAIDAVKVQVQAAGTTTPVAGQVGIFFDRIVWLPDAPLAASTTYEVSLHVVNQEPAPAGAIGPLDQHLSFTTGTALLAPFALTSEPTYTFEPRDFSYCPPGETINDCGQCSQSAMRSSPAVTVTPPTVSGGASSEGVFVTAWLTSGDGLPAGTVNLGSGLAPGQPGPIVLPIPEEDAPYQACLHVEVSDAAGHRITTDTRCFEASVATPASSDDAPPTSAPATGSSSSADGSDGGCNTSGQSGSGSLLLVGLAALIARLTRRHLTAP